MLSSITGSALPVAVGGWETNRAPACIRKSAPMPPIHRLSNLFKDVEAEHLKWMREAIANSRELLISTLPDTFAGRKTYEPFSPPPRNRRFKVARPSRR